VKSYSEVRNIVVKYLKKLLIIILIEIKGIRGIVLEEEDKFRLIDGYHRIYSTSGHKVKDKAKRV
jgi:hypothetical protein